MTLRNWDLADKLDEIVGGTVLAQELMQKMPREQMNEYLELIARERGIDWEDEE